MKVLLAGDVHGNAAQARLLVDYAAAHAVVQVVAVGDFGFWPHVPGGADYLDDLSRRCTEVGVTWSWLDGNHENFDALAGLGALSAGGPVDVWQGIRYLPRGCVVDLGGRRVLALGGAVSVDRVHRVEGLSWWPQEQLTDADVARALAAGPVDLLLTHDAPEGVVPVVRDGYKTDAVSRAHRERISGVTQALRPQVLVHGHYHHRYDALLPLRDGGGTRVHGLGRDGSGPDSFVVLDTDDLTVSAPVGPLPGVPPL